MSEQELEQEEEAEETISQDLLASQPSTTSAAESKVVPGSFSHLLISCPLFGVAKFSLTTTLIFVSSLHADSQATPSGTPTKKPKPTPEEKKALLEAKKEAKRETSARSEHFLPALTDLITHMVSTRLELEKQLVQLPFACFSNLTCVRFHSFVFTSNPTHVGFDTSIFSSNLMRVRFDSVLYYFLMHTFFLFAGLHLHA